jgi:O-antigen/teichoic acid export membrane protein
MDAALRLIDRTRRGIRSWSDAMLLARVVLIMATLPLLLRLDMMTLLRLLERLGRVLGARPRWSDDQVVVFVRACGSLHRWGFQDNCVAQSLTLFTLLNTPTGPLDVAFGVEVDRVPQDGAPRLGRRHVWLERDGTAVFEREPMLNYLVQTRYRTRTAQPDASGTGVTLPGLLGVLGTSSVGTGMTTVAALTRTKLVALLLGPAGLAVAGQVSSAMLALSWMATFGTSAGTTRHLAEALERGDSGQAATVAWTATALIGGASLALSVLALLGAPELARWLFASPDATSWILWLVPAVPATAVLSLAAAVLRGTRQPHRLALAQTIGAVFAVAAAFLLVSQGTLLSIVQLALAIVVLQTIAVGAAAWPSCRPWLSHTGAKWSGAVARQIAEYGLGNVVMGVSTAVGALVVGRTYLNAGHTDAAGRIAALLSFGEPLVAVLVSGLNASAFPAYCAASGQDANRVLSRTVRALTLFTAMPLVVMAAGADLIVALLFSPAFSDLAALLPWQTVAAYVRGVNILLGLPLLARGRVGVVTGLHLLWVATASAGATFGLGGPRSYVAALLAAGIVQTVLLTSVLAITKLAPSRRDYGWLALGALPLVLVAWWR